MISTLKLRLLDRLNSQFGITLRPQETVELMGRSLTVIKGSIRLESDYDDAWSWALASRSEIIFDIGANIGQSALLMLQSPIIKKLYLVDPNPEALSFAAENLFLNNLS
ncbi:MAG: hypothetical protein KAG66_20605, partial [Methylococcales bacterium]|nr:hypothetical protein [Methylococcales bacterium]